MGDVPVSLMLTCSFGVLANVGGASFLFKNPMLSNGAKP
jgi:hypothetical protein